MVEKKNNDYSKSAVNLTNPPQVKELLDKLHDEQTKLGAIKAHIPATIQEEIEEREKNITDLTAAIKSAITTFGSYQDVEAGVYGVYSRMATKKYDASQFKIKYSQYAPAVIVESVNVEALKGLIKGGLINEDELKERGVITETEKFQFVIR